MEEPAFGLTLAADLDHRAIVPVRLAELARLLKAIDNAAEDSSIPAAWLAVASHAVLRVPAAAIGLPGHLRVAADVIQIDIAGTALLGSVRIVGLALNVR